jgi:predicted aspartyl protease
MWKIAGLLLLKIVLAPHGIAHAGNCPTTPDRYCDDRQPHRISVKIYRNFLVVAEGRLEGVPESQNFILDTGTAPSIINVRLVKQLGLATIPSSFTAIGKIIAAQAAVLPELTLGPIRAVSLPVVVQDLSQLERDLGIPIAGLVGLDVLSKSSFRLNYDKREIEFGEISHKGIPVQFNARAGLAVAEMEIEGKELHILVDTGSDQVVLLGGNIAKQGWLALRNTSQTGTSLVDGNMDIRVIHAPDMILEGQHFSVERVYFIPGRTDPVFDGLLGVRALGFRCLSYDPGSGAIYLQR